MFSFDVHTILMWTAIIGLVALVSVTGMYINRFFIYRAHRRTIAELHRRAVEAGKDFSEVVKNKCEAMHPTKPCPKEA